tara:strand:+ start:180 stop:467 length:288 start_codon:yes stop_codon:yes gene_type:complete
MENPELKKTVSTENDLKNMLVEYVGENLSPENQNVTVEMVIEVMAKEFPEFLLVVAEENWIRGYQQAIDDVDSGQSLFKQKNEKQRTCKLCEDEK